MCVSMCHIEVEKFVLGPRRGISSSLQEIGLSGQELGHKPGREWVCILALSWRRVLCQNGCSARRVCVAMAARGQVQLLISRPATSPRGG